MLDSKKYSLYSVSRITDILGPFSLSVFYPELVEYPEHWGNISPFFFNLLFANKELAWARKIYPQHEGVALCYADTKSEWFKELSHSASGFLFLSSHLRLFNTNTDENYICSKPSVLISFGETMSEKLQKCELKGFYFPRPLVK